MSKTLKYLPEGQDFGAQHFTRAEAFRKTSPFCEGGMAKRYAVGGRVKNRKAPEAAPPPPDNWGEDMTPQELGQARMNMTAARGQSAVEPGPSSARERNEDISNYYNEFGEMPSPGKGALKRPAAPGKQMYNSPMRNTQERGVSNVQPGNPPAQVDQGIDELNETSGAMRSLRDRRPANGGFAKGGPLSAKQRHALPKSDFALAGERYPVNDANHARNALARVSQHGSPAEKSKVRAKVKSKYPAIEQHLAKGGPVKGYARGGALSMQQPMAAPVAAPMAAPMAAPAAAPAMGGGGNALSDMVNGPLAGLGAQMQPGSPLHKAVAKIGQEAAKKIVKHITGGKGTHGGKHAPRPRAAQAPVMRAEGGPIMGFADGGDVAEDRTMVTKGVHQHESNMHTGKPKTPLKLADGGPINQQPQDPRGRTTRHNGTPGGEVPYGVGPSHETRNAPFHGLRDGGAVRR